MDSKKTSMILLPAVSKTGETPPCRLWFETIVRPILKPHETLYGFEATPEHCKFFIRKN